MKILIVDDNSDARKLLRYNLERRNCAVIEARDGVEGLELTAVHKPDLIISDALMPGMDGFQFLRAVKTDKVLRSVPFIFYSATYVGNREAELAMSLGAEAFIAKPKEPDEFWKEVSGIIEGYRLKADTNAAEELLEDDLEYLKKYSNIVATKLEGKILELQEANARIEQSEAFIRNILESVDEGFIVVDPEYRVVSANRAYLGMVDLPIEKVTGRHCYELAHYMDSPCYKAGVDCVVKHTFETGEPHTALHVHKKGGNPFNVETKSFPMKNAAGEIVSVIEIINDITEKCKLEDQLRQAQKMEAIGQIAAGISHDFNNILTAIIGYASILQMKMRPDDPLIIHLDQILSSADRAASLTQSLLAFSRKQVSNPAKVNLNSVVKRVEKFLVRVIGEDIELKTTLPNEDLTVMADTSQMEQVFMNLATNARDAMPNGGTISISTGTVHLDRGFIKMHGYGEPGAYVLIAFTDIGTGMDKRTIDRIFDPFFTTKEIGKGTGLGLSIVYGIVKQHGGYINCYSELGKGTTFRIYLPMTKAEGPQKTKTPERVAPAGGTETILVAEDDDAVRKLSIHLLEESGYKVIEAVNGEDAVEIFMTHRDEIQLLFFDLIMPKINGREAYEKIKHVRQDVKALFTSGYPEEHIYKQDIIAQGLDFIAKPAPPAVLLSKIREVLDK
ncbi:MAG: response regulator [Nitrospirae bacterium]|nr:response regulator [Nitrospirota bacterium]MBI4847247.1 response regulator [Nitrospirota bacterium]